MFDIQIFVWVFVSYRNALNIKNSSMKVKIIFKTSCDIHLQYYKNTLQKEINRALTKKIIIKN